MLQWTYKNDFIEPFPEIVLFLSIILVANQTFFVTTDAAGQVFSTITWSLILLIIILVAIGGSRSYAMALERGEIAHQMLALRISRRKFALLKWLSLYIMFVTILFSVDLVAFFLYFGYFPFVSAYSAWASAPVVTFCLMIAEQMVLLLFLNSLMMALSFGIKRTTASMLVFLIFALLTARLHAIGPSGILGSLQLGYGDYTIVNSFSAYLFALLYRPVSTLMESAPPPDVLVGLVYRLVGGIVLLLGSVELFTRSDLD